MDKKPPPSIVRIDFTLVERLIKVGGEILFGGLVVVGLIAEGGYAGGVGVSM
jgi:hypothetical protein